MRPLSIVVILILVTLTGCHVNSQYINRDEDKKEAEQVTNKLYDLLRTKDYEATTELFSKRFFEVTDKEKLFRIFNATSEKLGELKTTEIETWETKRIEGTNPSANYVLIYKNKYEKFDSKETIQLSKDEDGKIRIIGYFINSDGFIIS
jgi:hypothetical protein